MRLNINLASQPYEDAKQFWMRWGTGLGVLAILTLALIVTTISGWFAARRDHANIAQLKSEIAQRDRTRQQAEDFLNRPENRSTRDQSQFLNELIQRKSFSWTRVLEDLEKVMPARVHLVAIQPELDDDSQLKLKLAVAGDSRDRALELARRMEDSRRFTRTYVASESTRTERTGEDPFQFNLEAVYVPETVPLPGPKTVASGNDNKAENKSESTPTELSKRTTP